MNTELTPDWTLTSRLWLVLDQAACAPRSPAEVCRQAISGGVEAVLCRLRNISESDKLAIASEARLVCAEQAVPFVVSHDRRLAELTGADGIQFGKADGPLNELSDMAGEGMRWGYSSHSIEEARDAITAGASWVFLGPVYPTPEKLKYGSPLGLAVVQEASRQALSRQLVFIGGITQDNLAQLIINGASRVAAISALQHTDDPALAAARFRSILEQ